MVGTEAQRKSHLGKRGYGGAPKLFTEAVQDEVLEQIRKGSTIRSAMLSHNLSPATYYEEIDNNPAFAAKVRGVEKDKVNLVANRLFEKAVEGEFNSMKFYLTNRDAENWSGELRIKSTNTQVTQSAPLNTKDLTDDELQALNLLLSKCNAAADKDGAGEETST